MTPAQHLAISVRQPWADLISAGVKTIEARSWRTHHRGDILIIASAVPACQREDADGTLVDLPTGTHICIATLFDCRPLTHDDIGAACFDEADWQPGLWAWCLGGVRAVEPVPQRGRLGLYRVPAELIRMG